MTQSKDGGHGRRSIITGLGLAAAGIAATAATPAHAQRSRNFTPERHDLDAWMDAIPGSHRIFVDSASANGGADALRYASNIYNAHQTDYSGSADDLATIVCFRHFSTPYGYGNAVWQKYGAQFAAVMQMQTGGAAPTANPLLGAAGAGGDPFAISIDSLVSRGAHFAICNTATRFISSQIASATGSSADDVYAEIVASVITNGRFVPAGVMALTRAQEYGYSLLVAG